MSPADPNSGIRSKAKAQARSQPSPRLPPGNRIWTAPRSERVPARVLDVLLPPCGGESRSGRGAAETFGPAREGFLPSALLSPLLDLQGRFGKHQTAQILSPPQGGRKIGVTS